MPDLLLALALLCGAPGSLPIAAAEPSPGGKVGLSLPLAGDAAALGRQFLAGARLALETQAAGRGIELVVADDGCDGDIGELAAADLRDAGVDLVTGLLCQDATLSAAELFKTTGIPLLVAGAQTARLPGDSVRHEWNLWRMAPGDDYPAAAAARELSVRWKGMAWAIVDDGTVYGRNLADDMRARMEEAGQPPQFADNFRPAQSAQAGLIRRLQRSGVSAVFIAANAEDIAIIAADAKEFGGRFEIAGSETLDLLPWIEQAASTPNGLLAVIAPHPSSLPSAEALNKLLDERGIEPERYVYVGYAAMQTALAALGESAADTTQALARTRFSTAIGEVQFDAVGRNVNNPYGLFVWRNGSFRPIAEPFSEPEQEPFEAREKL